MTAGLVAAALSSSSPRVARSGSAAPGDAARLLAPIEHQGQPPLDILDATPFPAGTRVLGPVGPHLAAGQYDQTVACRAPGSPAALITFYRKELSSHGWSLLSAVAAVPRHPGEEEVLAKHPSGDGYYWELGLTVTVVPAAHGQHHGTFFDMRIYEMTDAD